MSNYDGVEVRGYWHYFHDAMLRGLDRIEAHEEAYAYFPNGPITGPQPNEDPIIREGMVANRRNRLSSKGESSRRRTGQAVAKAINRPVPTEKYEAQAQRPMSF